MSEMMEKYFEKAKAEGKAEGIAEGRMIQMYEFVHDGDIPLDIAAKKAGMTEEEFKAGMEEFYSQLASA